MFLVEIKPYRKILEVYKEGHGIPSDRNTLKEILDIFDKYIKFAEYPDSEPSKLNCGGCITNAFNRLLGKIEREGHQPIKLTPNIPALEPLDISEKDAEIIVEEVLPDVIKSLKWGEFKSYCKEQGLNVKGKTKKQLLKELGIS